MPKTRRWKTFAGEYVMIVLSIVTALALENGVRQWHQAREAQEAARNLDAEIAANIVELRSVLKQNIEQVDKTKQMKTILLADIKAKVDDREAVKHAITATGGRFGVSMVTPSLQHEAWDVAVANQSLSYMQPDRLKHYATQYATMRDMQTVMANKGNDFLDLTQVANVFSNFELGELNARELYRVLTQMGSVYESNASMLTALEKLMVDEQQKTRKLDAR